MKVVDYWVKGFFGMNLNMWDVENFMVDLLDEE